MSHMQERYVEWIKETLACHKCSALAPHIVNGNITLEQSLPQAGFLGERYEDHKVLVLGKNPAKGRSGSQGDAEYYNRLSLIQDTDTLEEQTPYLRMMHSTWEPLRTLDLPKTIGLELSQVAYANQILCRDSNGRIGQIEKSNPSVVGRIYDNCFSARVCSLISILKPNHIIAIGRKEQSSGIGSWPKRLQNLWTDKGPCDIDITVYGVIFPFTEGQKQEARNDLLGLRQALGLLSSSA